ncbi:hypothetical protein KC332_g9359 [Hortaea werneckii]|uniref:Uncharacterized protein n=2 Tax=Hortaea werneckii TaxID=91943 RepID=A0A3M7JDT1_HORWE|nr:hypothetical protein KC358_g3270 [Hortaea werneckii]OTA27169.1 hypothetical protein BTJ68_10801 [Hortaea werneckii EXF-2000]KAI6846515.1 hypothetical protein KC350_g3887 [Hortaea werneckii]KAI6945911.1 hypothetical protein KC348_g3487 [Hortaea werneckii]KAI6964536.1 hypothetical protein KC321_g10616 [Hortaea werneckii]
MSRSQGKTDRDTLDITDRSAEAATPSSPSSRSNGFSVASPPSVLQSRGRGLERDELLGSNVSRLQPPRTPVSTRSRARDTSSDYYTAIWGSPYERSVSPSTTARTALSEQVPSEYQLESSPIPTFGLEHLVPSRLGDLSLLRPELSVPLQPYTEEEDNSHTPRSRTKRWVHLPQRDPSERPHRRTRESQSHSESEDINQSRATSPLPERTPREQASKGHKKREENRTLNQQTFLEILKDDQVGEMSSLYASRWADTPPPEEEEEAAKVPLGNAVAEKPLPELPKEQQTPPNNKEPENSKGEETLEKRTDGVPQVKEPDQSEPPSNASSVPRVADSTRLEPPRLKKRLSWRGKTCIVQIPSLDFHSLGLPMPMNRDEVQQRIKSFEDAGYNTQGFDLSSDQPSDDLGHARPIYPDENETQAFADQNPPKVMLPDLNRWKKMQDDLIEAKLAALGVASAPDEPPEPPSEDPLGQSSVGQYQSLPFSPPITTGSAGSIGRPGPVRGHSQTMSVASSLSPGVGPLGHMHRHSTFAGPFGFPQLQNHQLPQQNQSPLVPSMQTFSPQLPLGSPGVSRGNSPAQFPALRQDLAGLPGSGSPLGQQMVPQTPQDYSRDMVADQRRRQHGYSQSMQPSSISLPPQSSFMPQLPSLQQTPVLPELPEEDDEEELQEQERVSTPDLKAYVPPHKRAEFNSDIAVPSPTRGHRHNPSEGLEREVLEAEQRRESGWRDVQEATEQLPRSETPADKEPPSEDPPTQEEAHAFRKSGSRFNPAASSFSFNPGATFTPGKTAFTFDPTPAKPFSFQGNGHTRQASSGSSNVSAPSFTPKTQPALPKTDFNFSAQGPTCQPAERDADTERTQDDTFADADQPPSIFGKVDIPDIVKPARRSKAVAIVKPEESADAEESEEDHEDSEGRIAASDERHKRQRKRGDSGDQVPQFAEPTPLPPLPSFSKGPSPFRHQGPTESTVDQFEAEMHRAFDAVAGRSSEESEPVFEKDEPSHAQKPSHGHSHKSSGSLSALARPFKPSGADSMPKPPSREAESPTKQKRFDSISELEDGEIREDEEASTLPSRQSPPRDGQPTSHSQASGRIGEVAHGEPSFDEIDAVMRQLNEADGGDEQNQTRGREQSPIPRSEEQAMPGVEYIQGWSRDNLSNRSPVRPRVPADSAFSAHERTETVDPAANSWPQIHRLNKAEDAPPSEWSDMLSSPDQNKLHARSGFFDNHIEDVLGRVVDRRLRPFEDALRTMQTATKKKGKLEDPPFVQRASSTAESDADDEDDLSDAPRQRPISRGRDKRVDDIKAAVLEALREQSPRRPKSSHDIADLHSALADMKVSFARAASASLELEDVRVVVEEVMSRHNQALVSTTGEEQKFTHQREMSELEGRLNETLAGALEEANHRRSVEEREAESRRMLRLAEEELQLLRDSNRDDDGRFSAMEEERRELLERAERAEEANQDAEERIRGFEAENEAMQGTLEEYRMSSTKWRQDIDEAQREREELEKTISELERQLEDGQESSASMRRRLEKLHHDMATAAGQLTSEKASWKSREEDYRLRCEALEAESAHRARKEHELQEELRVARATMTESSDARVALEQARASNMSLDELVGKLQAGLAEQQALTARYERDFHDSREASRAEISRTRMSLETEVEAANYQVNVVRAELEGELFKVRTALENAKMEAENARERHERLLEEEDSARREALRKVNHANSVALDEARSKHESGVQDLMTQHARAMQHAIEDKQRSEYILNERLSLSEAKLEHANDRILHLEERLEIAKSAAQAAVMNVQSRGAPGPVQTPNSSPEKVSPQALRESILVLQEQLQERESHIDRLQNKVDNEGPTKLKERDSEIAWLRELLSVRNEDLTELVNTLARPTFDRDAVRDIAIRIRANLQMEQQEKERLGHDGQSLGNQALASLSSFATPKAASLTTAFNKWRTNMESSALKSAPRSAPAARSGTPSKTRPSALPSGYVAGLMTPPASNVRNTPSPDALTSLPPPRLQPRSPSNELPRPSSRRSESSNKQDQTHTEQPATPLFGEHSYDHDAKDNGPDMQTYEDDDLDIADDAAPAFRSLEEELDTQEEIEASS